MQVLRFGAESRKPSQCIKIGNACNKIGDACIKIGNACNKIRNRKPSHCIKIGNACIKIWNRVFLALCDIFRYCEAFSKKFQKLLSAHRPRG